MSRPQRVDPKFCGCTDCLVGYSVPLNQVTQDTVKDLVRGRVQNATSAPLSVTVTVSDDRTPVLTYSVSDVGEVDA